MRPPVPTASGTICGSAPGCFLLGWGLASTSRFGGRLRWKKFSKSCELSPRAEGGDAAQHQGIVTRARRILLTASCRRATKWRLLAIWHPLGHGQSPGSPADFVCGCLDSEPGNRDGRANILFYPAAAHPLFVSSLFCCFFLPVLANSQPFVHTVVGLLAERMIARPAVALVTLPQLYRRR